MLATNNMVKFNICRGYNINEKENINVSAHVEEDITGEQQLGTIMERLCVID